MEFLDALFGRDLQGRQNSRFVAALLCSGVLHTVVLIHWTQQQTPPLGGASTMTVQLRGPDRSSSGEEVSGQEPASQISTSTRNDDQQPTTENSSPASASKQTQGSISGRVQQANIGSESGKVGPPGTVLVIIGVDPDGHVKQITWTNLPPVSWAKVQSLESALRQDIYLPLGKEYVVRKNIDLDELH